MGKYTPRKFGALGTLTHRLWGHSKVRQAPAPMELMFCGEERDMKRCRCQLPTSIVKKTEQGQVRE